MLIMPGADVVPMLHVVSICTLPRCCAAGLVAMLPVAGYADLMCCVPMLDVVDPLGESGTRLDSLVDTPMYIYTIHRDTTFLQKK